MSLHVRRALVGIGSGLVVAAALVPNLAAGNARREVGNQAPAAALERPLVANLLGSDERPDPGDPDGSGAAAVTIDPADNSVCYDLAVAGIEPATLAHIHRGARGVAGPVVVNFTPPTPTSSGSVTADALLVEEILANPAGFYVNVHNASFPGGAVRGQLAPGAPGAGATHMLAEPLRAYDSRTVGGKLAPGTTRTASLQQGMSGSGAMALAVPPGATAALVTLTITETEDAGYVKLYSAALAAEPPTSNINWWTFDQNLAVTTTVAVDASAQVKLTGGVAATHVVLDVVGFLY